MCAVDFPESSISPGDTGRWTASVPTAVHSDGVVEHPGSYLRIPGGLELLLDAAREAGALEDDLLAWRWPGGSAPLLGELAPAWTYIDLSTGVTRTPSAVLASHSAVSRHGAPSADDLDLDGSGVATSPIGMLRLERLTLAPMGGSGLATSPIGLVPIQTVGFDTNELVDVLGFHPLDAHGTEGSGLATSPIGVTEGPVNLGTGATLGWNPDSFATLEMVDRGGMRATGGLTTSAALVGVGLLPETAAPVQGTGGEGAPVGVQ